MNQVHLLKKIVLLSVFVIMLAGCKTTGEDVFVLEKAAEGLNFPEGPAWNGTDRLYLSNCTGGWIAKYEASVLDTFISQAEVPEIFGKTNGLTVGKDGNVYACEYGMGSILKISPDARAAQFITGYDGRPFNRPNDLAFNSKGDLYFTDPKSYDPGNRDGVVYVYSASTGRVKPLINGMAFPNGIAFSGDEKFLFVCESAMNRILKFKMITDSTVSEAEVFVELPGGDPDGIAFDMNGNLYAAHFGTGKVFIINPAGEVVREIIMPGKKPTNVEFAGPDMRTLYITEVETNALYRLRTDIPGRKLF